MLKLEDIDYDLNYLCSFTFDFQMLKDILLKLAISNEKLRKKIKKLEKSNEEKDKRISNIEEQFNILYIPEQNSFSDSEKSEESQKKEEKDKNKEKEDFKELKIEDKEKKIKQTTKKETKFENEKEDDKEKEETSLLNSKRSLNKKSLKELESRNSYIQQYPQVSHETIKSLLKLIRENSEKIGKLEKSITKKLNKTISDFEKTYNDLNTDNTKEHKEIYTQLKDIKDKLFDYNDKMDGIIVKTAPLDTLSFFRDSGNGDINATKVMVKMLEEKVNKKIEIIEKKNKDDNNDYEKFKKKLEELEQIINQELKKNKEKGTIGSGDKNYDEDIQSLKDLIEEKYNDLLKIIEDLSTQIQNGELLENRLNELINKTKLEKDNNATREIKEALKKEIPSKGLGSNIEIGMTDLKNRIKEINKKLNEMDSYFKNLFNNSSQDIGEIKQKITEIDSILEKKITKEELKALEMKSEEHSNAIEFIQDSLNDINQNIVKLSENNPNIMKRIENISNEIFKLKERDIKDNSSKPLDMNKFVDENKLKEVLKNINKMINEINTDKNMLYNNMKEINENIKTLETKERIAKFEDDINNKIDDFFDKIRKKYVEKIEINKYMKNMDIRLKLLDTQHKDADSWILAKQPIGCFNCASCEANIKNVSTSNDYVHWNKYPQAERQYHMGRGFSRLLQKIGNEKIQSSIEKKDMSSDNELTKTNYFNNMPNIKGNNGHFFFRINNRETMKDELVETNNSRYKKNHRLPNLKNKRAKNENIPLTDEESEIKNTSMDNSNSNSPKIMKITKKSIEGKLGILNPHQMTVNSEHKFNIDSSSIKSKSKLERIQSLPIYDNA